MVTLLINQSENYLGAYIESLFEALESFFLEFDVPSEEIQKIKSDVQETSINLQKSEAFARYEIDGDSEAILKSCEDYDRDARNCSKKIGITRWTWINKREVVKSPVNRTIELISKGVEDGRIPKEYHNLYDLSVIANVILYGGDISYKDPKFGIGMNLYQSTTTISELKTEKK